MINRVLVNSIIRNQKNIAILLTAVISTFIVFWFFIYIPRSNEMGKIIAQYESVENDIKKIESMAGGKGKLDTAMMALDEKLKALEQKLPQSEETTFRELSTYANKLGIDVISITPKDLKQSACQGSIPLYVCMQISVDMRLKGTFKKIGEYVKLLQENFPILLVVKSLDMNKEKPQDKINNTIIAELKLDMYMLQKK